MRADARRRSTAGTLVARLLWPLLVCSGLSAAYFASGSEYRELFLVAGPFPFLALLVGLEWLVPARPEETIRNDPQILNDLGHNFVGQGLGGAVGEVTFIGAAAILASKLYGAGGEGLWPTSIPWLAQVLLLLVLAEGLEYVRHRTLHSTKRLWPFHAIHHSDGRLHAIKGGRNHFVDVLTGSLAVFAPLVLIGVPPEILFWYPATLIVISPLSHANMDMEPPACFHKLIVTPQVHYLHHARSPDLANGNFTALLPAWDLLFGTFRDPAKHQAEALGIEGDLVPEGFLDQLRSPFLSPV